MKNKFFFLLAASFILTSFSFAQSKDSISKFKIGGYIDTYYAYYTDSVPPNNYQKFPVVSPKSEIFGLNIIQITAQYTSSKIRALTTIHYGDIPSSAWSKVYNMIQEANVGIRLSKNVWLDAGFFKTHIGAETLLPKDNIVSSLAMISYYEPWLQAGIKLSYLPNDKLIMCLHVLNGYNIYLDNNKSKSVGLSLSYLLGNKGSLSYYNILGEESPEGTKNKHLRLLNNVVFNYQLTEKLKTSIGVDYIAQQHSNLLDSAKSASVYSAILTFKYQLKPQFGIYVRGEMFSDKDGFLTGQIKDLTGKSTGYIVNGGTIGVEYKPTESSFIRLEGRELIMEKNQEIFIFEGHKKNYRSEILLNFGVWF